MVTKRRRKSGMSPTARTLAECRKRGWIAQVVEQTLGRTFIKRDLFGAIDVLAVTDRDQTLGIQATSGANHASRRAKILTEPRMRRWLEAGNFLEVWSWSKTGKRGKRKVWTLREEQIVVQDFEEQAEEARAA